MNKPTANTKKTILTMENVSIIIAITRSNCYKKFIINQKLALFSGAAGVLSWIQLTARPAGWELFYNPECQKRYCLTGFSSTA
jgi:hypothetical protein